MRAVVRRDDSIRSDECASECAAAGWSDVSRHERPLAALWRSRRRRATQTAANGVAAHSQARAAGGGGAGPGVAMAAGVGASTALDEMISGLQPVGAGARCGN